MVPSPCLARLGAAFDEPDGDLLADRFRLVHVGQAAREPPSNFLPCEAELVGSVLPIDRVDPDLGRTGSDFHNTALRRLHFRSHRSRFSNQLVWNLAWKACRTLLEIAGFN